MFTSRSFASEQRITRKSRRDGLRAVAVALAGFGALGLVAGCATRPAVATRDDAATTISGSATYRERMMAPAGSVLKVTLSDVSRADAPAVLLDEWTASMDEGSVPRTFTLRPATPLDPRMTYAVRAVINGSDGALLWTTDTLHSVSPDGSAAIDVGEIVMVKVAPSAAAAPVSRLAGTEWLIEATGGTAIVSGQEPTIRFGEDGRVSGFSGCNRFTGGYTEDGDMVTFSPLASTMMACMSAETGAQERAIQAILSGETRISFDAMGLLTVTSATGKAFVARKSGPDAPAPDAALLKGGAWVVEDINRTGIIDRSRLTLAFGEDGRVSGSGGCNGFSGTYTVTGGTVTFSPLASTRRACVAPAVSAQETRYFAALGGEMAWTILADGALELTGEEGRRVLLRR